MLRLAGADGQRDLRRGPPPRPLRAFSAAGYCQARQRLPLAVLSAVGERVAAAALSAAGANAKARADPRWLGRRVFLIDGSSVGLPDAPAVRKHFGCSGKQRPGCGYPTAHVLLLVGPGGVAVDAACSPLRTGDMTHAAATHARLSAGDLLLGDRQFGGWGHLHRLQAHGLDGLFPAHQSRHIGWGARAGHGPNRRFVRTLGWHDQLVQYRKPAKRPEWMDAKAFAAAPQWITVREVRRQVRVGGVRRWVTLVTTLTDAKACPAKALVKLLGERWTVETCLRSLKTTMGMERLRCHSVQGVKKELAMYLIVYNLVRLLMLRAAARQGVADGRVSFADALACLRHGDPSLEPELEVVPERPGRDEPRAVKQRPKAFPRMTKPRDRLRRIQRQARQAAADKRAAALA